MRLGLLHGLRRVEACLIPPVLLLGDGFGALGQRVDADHAAGDAHQLAWCRPVLGQLGAGNVGHTLLRAQLLNALRVTGLTTQVVLLRGPKVQLGVRAAAAVLANIDALVDLLGLLRGDSSRLLLAPVTLSRAFHPSGRARHLRRRPLLGRWLSLTGA